MNNFRKIKKNAKALSPVVASIILIAVTVAVSVVVAAWMGGVSLGLMGNAEQASITNIAVSSTGNVAATVQNTGKSPITMSLAYVNGTSVDAVPAFAPIPAGTSVTYDLTGVPAASTEYVTVKLTTTKGNNIVLADNLP